MNKEIGSGLSERGKALEDKYFHERDQKLLREMREKQAETPAAEPAKKPQESVSTANPHSDRPLEELYFEEENRRAIEALKGCKK